MRVLAVLLAVCWALPAWAENTTTPGEVTTPYPTLIHLAIEWKIAGDDNLNATCAVKFREAGGKDWREGLPLRRVPAGKSQTTNPVFTWENKFSGSLFDLKPGTEYEIELKLNDPDGGSAEKTVKARTRPVPRAPAGMTARKGGPGNLDAKPGELVELAAGSYGEVTIARDGEPGRPIIYRSPDGKAVFEQLVLNNRKHVWIEGVTIENKKAEGSSKGFKMVGSEDCVVRRCRIEATYGIWCTGAPGAKNCYIADNVFIGPTKWNSEAMGASGKNIGEGVQITGPGNVVCFNKLTGFRDCLSHMEDSGTHEQVCNDFYNNDVYLGLDDGIEADFAFSNCRIVRNRLTNCFVGLSSQPGLGGPTYFIRNVMYNLTYAPFKLHRFSSGDVILHNTVVKPGDGLACFAGQPFDHCFMRNNLCIGGPDGGQKWGGYGCGSGQAMALNAHGPHCDFDYDALGTFKTPFAVSIGKDVRAKSIAELKQGPFEKHAVQVDLSAFKEVAFPEDPAKEQAPPDLRPLPGAPVVDAAQRLPNVNDGFLGNGPDMGAYEAGQELPHYGPRAEGEDEEAAHAKRSTPKTGDAERPANPAVPVAQPAIDPAPHREAIAKALRGGSKAGKVYLKVMGVGQEVAFKSADEQGVTIEMQGNKMPLRWKDLGAEDHAQLALRLLPDDEAALFAGGALAVAEKNDALAQKVSDRLNELKSPKAAELEALRKK